MADLTQYEIAKKACDLIAMARGLPAGSLQPEDMDIETLHKEMDELATAITVMEWGLVGCMAILYITGDVTYDTLGKWQYKESDNPMFPFKRWVYYASALPDILRGDTYSPLIPIEYHAIAYKCGRKDGDLTIEDRAAILGVMMASKLSVAKSRELMKTMANLRHNSVFSDTLKKLQAAAERRDQIWEENKKDDENADPE